MRNDYYFCGFDDEKDRAATERTVYVRFGRIRFSFRRSKTRKERAYDVAGRLIHATAVAERQVKAAIFNWLYRMIA